MKKTFLFIAMTAFVGLSAFSLNNADREDTKSAEKKSECATVSAASACSSSSEAVLASAAAKDSGCGEAEKVAGKVSGECSQESNVVLASGSEDASGCSSAGKEAKTATAEKAGCCSSVSAGSPVIAASSVSAECSDEKTDESRIAENN